MTAVSQRCTAVVTFLIDPLAKTTSPAPMIPRKAALTCRPFGGAGGRLGACQAPKGAEAHACGGWSVDSVDRLLPPHLLARTRASEGHAESWARVVGKLDRGEPVSLAVLGGSMSLPGQRGGWPERVAQG